MSTITLPNIRVSSDLTIRLKLKDGGVAIDWSTLQNIRVSLYSDDQRSMASRCSVSIDEEDSTVLVCQYAANKMQYLGVNRVIVQCKYMGEVKTYDKPAFNFVRWTSDQEGEQITIDDPDVDVEISVEDVSSSILQEAVDAAFSAADRANEAAEEAEHMVDIHTGPEGKSAYEVAVEEGYQGTEEEWLASLKGPVGETPDISIGTVTTVEPGTPAAASMGGTPEAPVLNLSIPKGLVGATPNFTVGTVTTGQPGSSVIVTITGTPEAPVLNLTIPQGMQGNTGSSVEYPYELVNNLTTDDATKGLSAAQGKVLDGKVSQLEAEVNQLEEKVDGEKYTETYDVVAGQAFGSNIERPIAQGEKIKVKATGDNIGTQVVVYAGTTSTEIGRVTINGDEVEMTSPIDASKLIIFRAAAYVPSSGTITVSITFNGGLVSDVQILKTEMDGILPTVEELDNKVNGEYYSGSNNSSGQKYFKFKFIEGETYVVANASASGSINAFTSDGTNDIETIKVGIDVGGDYEFIPSADADYIRVYFNGSNGGSFTVHRKSLDDKIDDVIALNGNTSDRVDRLSYEVHGESYAGNRSSGGSAYYGFAFRNGVKVTLKNTSASGTINAFTNDGTNDIQTIKTGLGAGDSISFVPNADAPKLRVYYNSPAGGSFAIESESIDGEIEKLNESVFGLNSQLNFTENTDYYYDKKDIGTEVTSESALLVSASGKYKAIDLSEYAGYKLKFKISYTGSSTSGRGTMLVANNIVVASYKEADILNQEIVLDIPANSVLYESHATNSTISVFIVSNGYDEIIQDVENGLKQLNECFVSSTGNDNNPGTKLAPFATVAHAIESGFKNICVFAGEYKEVIRLNGLQGINIYANDDDTYDSAVRKRPVFTNGDEYNSFQTATGYKYFTPTSVPSIYTNVFVNQTVEPIITYQSFANTYTVGLWAKCANRFDDFMFKPVLSLAELSENNTFFFDGTNVYFNTNADIEGVVVVGGAEHILNVSNCNNLHLSGLHFRYGRNDTAHIVKSNKVKIENCEFAYSLMRNNVDYSQSDIHLVNCESYKARRDGFNAAYYGIAYLENCNSRYNYDDGESSHEYCEVEILGGEYSHNGKAGHAPVNGVKFKCNGTYSHHNAIYGLLRPGVGAFDVEPYLISNSVFIDNGTSDIETYLELNLMNCKFGTRTGSGAINDLTGN